ncbi:MAG: class I SAM-dependent methyltransferase [Chloroflexi bacterium]|nr:class I SAM-dependent methyltransferase [Chloroflexota bacterium]
MPDHLFDDPELVGLYDLFSPSDERADFNFYLPLVMRAESVLDVGCGTGALLHRARAEGHRGRLCGIDPAFGMLEVARSRSDIDWILGDLASVSWEREFDLILMTGHAFQVFLEDADLRVALAVIHHALTEDGRFAFETRNPHAREWESWNTIYAGRVIDDTGQIVEVDVLVDEPVEGDIVRFSHTFSSPSWSKSQVSHSVLRFLNADKLSLLLAAAGLAVEHQFGDWDRSKLSGTSPEIITIARRADV